MSAAASPVARRDFVRLVVACAASPVLRHARLAPPVVLRLESLDVVPESASAMGFTLGVEEARHAATLFGASVEALSPSAPWSALSAVIGAGDRASCLDGARRSAGVPFINSACPDDDLRGTACARNLFHVAPSDAMLRDAGTGSVAWSSDLERFGADTLNRRFQARFGQPMTPAAWTSWFAVKAVWETVLRLRTGDGARILDALSSAQFDGHKGVPLSFRAWDRQLRQPLYRIESGKITQLPVETSRAALDQLGTSAQASACKL